MVEFLREKRAPVQVAAFLLTPAGASRPALATLLVFVSLSVAAAAVSTRFPPPSTQDEMACIGASATCGSTMNSVV